MTDDKVTQYASLEELVSQAKSWEGQSGRTLTTFAKRFDPGKDGQSEYAVACGNMAWRGKLDDNAARKLEAWLKARGAIKVEGVVSRAELFA